MTPDPDTLLSSHTPAFGFQGGTGARLVVPTNSPDNLHVRLSQRLLAEDGRRNMALITTARCTPAMEAGSQSMFGH